MIGRIQNLQLEKPRGWIEERVVAAARGGEKKIAWVKGQRSPKEQISDLRAKKEAWLGVRRGDRNIATAGGIRYEFRVRWRTREVQQ